MVAKRDPYPQGKDYTVYLVGSTYVAEPSKETVLAEVTGTSLRPVLNTMITNMNSNGGGSATLALRGEHLISGGSVIPKPAVELEGLITNPSGTTLGTILKLADSSNVNMFDSGVAATDPFIDRFKLKKMTLDGNLTNQTSAGGVWNAKTKNSVFNELKLTAVRGTGLYLSGESASFGFFNEVTLCHFSSSADVSIKTDNCDENYLLDNTFNFCSGGCIDVTSGSDHVAGNTFVSSGVSATPYAVLLRNINEMCYENIFDSCYGGIQLKTSAARCQVHHNQLGTAQIRNIQVDTGPDHVIDHNYCRQPNGASATGTSGASIVLSGSTVSDCLLQGNRIQDGRGTPLMTNGIAEVSSATANMLLDNKISGNTGTAIIFGGTASLARGNKGFNPQGVASISVTTGTFVYTNNDNVIEAIYIVGGTVSSIQKDTITLASASPLTVWLEPTESVTVVNTVVPTMNKDRK